MPYTAQCFSGECGLCFQCCETGTNWFENHQKEESASDCLRRAKDHSKLLGKKRVEEITIQYNKDLKKFSKDNGYKRPDDEGWTSHIKKFYKRGSFDPIVYKLIKTTHSAICDDPQCKVIYVNSSDWAHASQYPIMPMYTRMPNDDHQICGVCINRPRKEPSIA